MALFAALSVHRDDLRPAPRRVESYRTARADLRQYEGAWARVRVTGGALCLPFAITPPAVLALSVFVVRGGLASYAVGLMSLCTTWLPGWTYKSRLLERPVRARLTWHNTFDPSVARVSVNIAETDIEAARTAIRHASLIVEYTRTSGYVGADPRNTNISVAQWAYRPQVDDFAFRDAVCDVLGSVGIGANVGGTELNSTVS